MDVASFQVGLLRRMPWVCKVQKKNFNWLAVLTQSVLNRLFIITNDAYIGLKRGTFITNSYEKEV